MTIDTENKNYPVIFQVEYPERSSRFLALLGALLGLKFILLLPHLLILCFLGIAQGLVVFLGHWAVLVTGRYFRAMFNFGVAVQRWNLRTTAWFNGWTDSYPPFSLR